MEGLDEQLSEDLPPGVGLYGRPALSAVTSRESEEKPKPKSENPGKTEPLVTEEGDESSWWDKYPWKTIILIAIILQFVIRFIAEARKN